jgi:hypothetical protein
VQRKPNSLPAIGCSQQFVVDDIKVVVSQKSTMPCRRYATIVVGTRSRAKSNTHRRGEKCA